MPKVEMPKVVECGMERCSYNADGRCHALAITVGGPQPLCDTLLESGRKGGDAASTAGVGACKVEACSFNSEFECTAEEIHVKSCGPHCASCATYRIR